MLLDWKLAMITALAGVVSLLTTLNVAARPAAVRTGQVATAFTVAQLFFMVTRFANLFYLPLMARFVDEATRTGQTSQLYGQIQWVVVGAAVGALVSWLLLPTFVEIYCVAVGSITHRGMLRALLRMVRPASWLKLLRSFRRPSNLGCRLFKLDGVPADFLLFNVAATAVWTVGALAAVYVSAVIPQYKTTAVLLSGLVNAFAAIAFTIWVDPKAALITDQATHGKRPESDVNLTAVHLSAGNFLGALLGLAVLPLGVSLIRSATLVVGAEGESLAGGLWIVVALNALFALLASTTYSARITAVATRRVATALAVYNLFFLITRLAGQVYAPMLGAMSDYVVHSDRMSLSDLAEMFRWILAGASTGALLGWLLMPTFVEIYNRAVYKLDQLGSLPAVFLKLANPANWGTVLRCLRAPSLFGMRAAELKLIPRGFLIGNVIVLSIHTVGVMAAIYAGAMVNDELARTATLLSSVVNGIATIMLSVVVDPTTATIVDRSIREEAERPVYVMAVMLMAGMFLGTLLSQVLLEPAAHFIVFGARTLDAIF